MYGTGRVRQKFSTTHPDEKVLAADASKGTMRKADEDLKRGANWVLSQRAVVLLTDKRIKCGKWDIPLDSIIEAKLVKIRTTFGRGQVLKIATIDQGHFQFGMQINQEWTDQTVLPLTLEENKLKYSWFSIVTRLILLGYLVFWIIGKIKNGG